MTELKELRLHGMASAWDELASQGTASTASSKWLLEHLLQQEQADRVVRSVNHQMNMAKLPMHRDLAGFDFSASSADARFVGDLSSLAFTETAQNVVFIRKTHFAYYLPGVGTPFKEIGELTESSEGKSFAMGGEARIHWAMLNLYNAIHRSFYKSDLLQESEMKILVTKDLSTYFRHAIEEKEVRRIFISINQRLMKAMQYERPRITQLHLSVFGFSCSAAEAVCFAIGFKTCVAV